MRPWLPICIVDWKWTWWGTLLSGVGVGVGGGFSPGGFPDEFCPLPADFSRQTRRIRAARPASHRAEGFAGADSRTYFARSRRISGKHGGFGQCVRRRSGAEGFAGDRFPDEFCPFPADSRQTQRIGQRVRRRSGRGFAGITGTARQQATHPRSTDPKSRQKPIYTAVSAARGTRSIRATSGGLPIRGQDRMHKPRDTISRCPVRS